MIQWVNDLMIQFSLQPQHLGDAVPSRLLLRQPLSGAKRAVYKRVAICRHMRQLQSLAQRGEVSRVPADFIADAQRMHADFTALALHVITFSAVHDRLWSFAGRSENRIR